MCVCALSCHCVTIWLLLMFVLQSNVISKIQRIKVGGRVLLLRVVFFWRVNAHCLVCVSRHQCISVFWNVYVYIHVHTYSFSKGFEVVCFVLFLFKASLFGCAWNEKSSEKFPSRLNTTGAFKRTHWFWSLTRRCTEFDLYQPNSENICPKHTFLLLPGREASSGSVSPNGFHEYT